MIIEKTHEQPDLETDGDASNYWHWLTQYLGRLPPAEESTTAYFSFPCRKSEEFSSAVRTLEGFGFSAAEWVYDGERWHMRTRMINSNPTPGLEVRP